MKLLGMTIATAMALAAGTANAAEIVRHSAGPDAIILEGVTVPAGSETLYLSGQLADPIDPAKKTTLEDYGDTHTQAMSTFKKIKASLEKHGYTMADVVKLTVFVAGDPKLGGKLDFKGFNDAYKMFFGTTDQPNKVARSTVQVAALVMPQFLIEIEATAVKAPK